MNRRAVYDRQMVARPAVVYPLLVCILLVISFPIYWMLVVSLRGQGATPTDLIPSFSSLSLSSYTELLSTGNFPRWFLNTVIVAVLTTCAALICSVTAAYAISRLRFKGRNVFATTIILSQLAPGILIAIPIYTILADIGLLNNYFGLSAAYLTRALPFCIWMLWGFFRSLPPELEEAAQVDGANRIQALLRIVLPLSLPGIAVAGLFTFVVAWEEYLLALMIMTQDSTLTLTVGASRLVSAETIEWQELMAYSVLMTIPVAVVFGLVQKHMVRGITAGAVKT